MTSFVLNETTEKELLDYFRVSTRLDRACALVDVVGEVAPDIFTVKSQRDAEREYTVDLRSKTCDCPDWTFRGSVSGLPCKHLMAAYLAIHRKGPEA